MHKWRRELFTRIQQLKKKTEKEMRWNSVALRSAGCNNVDRRHNSFYATHINFAKSIIVVLRYAIRVGHLPSVCILLSSDCHLLTSRFLWHHRSIDSGGQIRTLDTQKCYCCRLNNCGITQWRKLTERFQIRSINKTSRMLYRWLDEIVTAKNTGHFIFVSEKEGIWALLQFSPLLRWRFS